MDWYRHKNNMQMRENRAGELVYLTFPILEKIDGVSHLFSTRMGGVSEGIYSSMNLSYTRGDEKESVDENFRRIAAVLGCGVEDMVCSDQTHTTNLRIVGKADGGKGITRERDYSDVDGLLTDEPGVYLATFSRTACPFILWIQGEKRSRWRIPAGGVPWRVWDSVWWKGCGRHMARIRRIWWRRSVLPSVRNVTRSARMWRTPLRRRFINPGRNGRYCLRKAAANISLICGVPTGLCWRRREFWRRIFRSRICAHAITTAICFRTAQAGDSAEIWARFWDLWQIKKVLKKFQAIPL